MEQSRYNELVRYWIDTCKQDGFFVRQRPTEDNRDEYPYHHWEKACGIVCHYDGYDDQIGKCPKPASWLLATFEVQTKERRLYSYLTLCEDCKKLLEKYQLEALLHAMRP